MSYLLAKNALLKKIKIRSKKKKIAIIVCGLSCLSTIMYSPTTFAVSSTYYGNNDLSSSYSEDVYNITGSLYDTDSYSSLLNGYTTAGNSYNNILNVYSGTYSSLVDGARITGGTGSAYSNTVNIYGGTYSSYIEGAYISSSGDAYDNTVNFYDGTVNGTIDGAYAGSGDVYNNTVNIYGGTISGTVYNYTSSGNSYNNNINIYGGTISGNIYGGYSNSGDVYGNTVTIDNTQGYTLDLSNATLYGGYSSSGSVYDNTLNVYGSDITAKNIIDFDTLNFYLSSFINGTTVLTLTDAADISDSTVNLYITGGTSTVSNGDTVTLIYDAAGLTADNLTYGSTGTLTEGVSLSTPITLSTTANSLIATATGSSSMKSQTKSLVETSAGSAAFINSGISMTSDRGISNAVDASAGMSGFAPFAAIGASSMTYNTGSHVDSVGRNLNIGLAKTIDNKKGKLTYGPLIEAGWGSYDSYLDSGIHADGNTNYTGGGLFARQTNKDGLYYEASLHYGHMDSDYNSNDLDGASYEHYKMNTPYYGMHMGVGKVINVDKKHDLDVYGKYYYSRQQGDDVNLSSGETYNFDAVNSSRLRAGARYTYKIGEGKKAYVGAAYEREFDGDARATYKGYSAPSPSLKGGSGMLEVGYQVKPTKTSPLTIDIGVNGWTGKQEGVGTNVSLNWKF